MISRRLIRVKVLQLLYAYFNGNNTDGLPKYEKDLQKSLEKSYDLYHLFFLLLIDVSRYAQNKIDIYKSKMMATEADLNPNTRFVDNKVVRQLEQTEKLTVYADSNTLNWNATPELIKHIYNVMVESDSYKAYMASPDNSYDADRKFVMNFFNEYMVDDDMLYQVLEENSIYWNDDIEFVLSMNIKTVERLKETSKSLSLMNLYKNEDDRRFATDLLCKTVLHHEENERLIRENIKNWDLERLAQMDLLIIEQAIVEITSFESIPVKVSLNEYIDLARFYSTDRSNAFVNGILDKIVNQMKAEGKIKKTGRGLIE